ncbi:MAG: collagen binding domain-containing protein, partial [Porticoccaceae bacterium]
ETAVPHGFVLDATPLPFSLVYVDQYTAIVTAEAGLYNERAKAEVRLLKTAEEVGAVEKGETEAAPNIIYVQAPAQGIVFGLYARGDILNVDGEVIVPAGSLMDVLTTDENGAAVSTQDIPFGAYYVKELATRPSLVPSDKEYDAVLEYADSATPLITVTINEGNPIENLLIKGKIKVIKTNEGKEPMAGVEFTVTGSGANEGITLKLVTDENGEAVTGLLPYGHYVIVESKTLAGYALDTNQHILLIARDGEVYEFGLVNEKIHGKIKVIKTDGATKAPLEGVVFEVFDKDGKVVATLTTGKDGTATTGWLPYGDYTVKEKTAKEGYVLDETVREIQIRENKRVYVLTLQNSRVPEKPKTPEKPTNPKTGDDSNPMLWLCIAAFSAIALAGIGVYVGRKKKKEDEEIEDDEVEV